MNLTFGITSGRANDIQPHMHPNWELLYYLEGEGTLTIGSETIDFSPGCIVCQPPNILHSEHSDGGFRNIYFHSPNFSPPHSSGISVYHDNESEEYGSLVKLAYRHYFDPAPQSPALVDGLIHVIYHYLELFESERDRPVSREIAKVKQILVERYTDPDFQLSTSFQEIGFCRDHLRRCFKKETGKTPHEFLLQLRMEHARRLLEEQHRDAPLTIREIALLSGFSDPYHFSNTFKRRTGMTPTEFVRRERRTSPSPHHPNE